MFQYDEYPPPNQETQFSDDYPPPGGYYSPLSTLSGYSHLDPSRYQSPIPTTPTQYHCSEEALPPFEPPQAYPLQDDIGMSDSPFSGFGSLPQAPPLASSSRMEDLPGGGTASAGKPTVIKKEDTVPRKKRQYTRRTPVKVKEPKAGAAAKTKPRARKRKVPDIVAEKDPNIARKKKGESSKPLATTSEPRELPKGTLTGVAVVTTTTDPQSTSMDKPDNSPALLKAFPVPPVAPDPPLALSISAPKSYSPAMTVSGGVHVSAAKSVPTITVHSPDVPSPAEPKTNRAVIKNTVREKALLPVSVLPARTPLSTPPSTQKKPGLKTRPSPTPPTPPISPKLERSSAIIVRKQNPSALPASVAEETRLAKVKAVIERLRSERRCAGDEEGENQGGE